MLKPKHYIKGLPFYMFENIHVEICVAMDTGLSLEQWSLLLGNDAVVTYRIKEHHTSVC